MALKCPFCDSAVAETSDTFREEYINFYGNRDRGLLFYENEKETDYDLKLKKLLCPGCERTSYNIEGIQGEYQNISLPVHPISNAKMLPEYIPGVLRSDYEEAYSILSLSPKASATLSRRCLQGMIRDFFEISKSSLNDEINSIEDLVSSDQKSVLHSLRKIGNVGAHLEKDVNLIIDVTSEDAEKLLLVLEYFFNEWYISKHNTELLFSDIQNIDKGIQEQRKI
ncbi:DUF4145 domain-containing protein [Salinicoccus roseus]|uniref:DUF4145 domain-containing protein n=1 Tax=Salinicoccus roseus TaxID=45670 RepID=A0A0C2DJ95_9STAP|nr:DUF4145 domain-containing protein [Salinicoccus roseus]KIH70048.1 hypothetical protein SN16_11135 [Salinicoccus roseus]MDB0581356.1 DUF4145 domain-containing protein [Salinicoccus roseus]